uniref:tRNA-queuosine alpha-mannosyltransferase n=1 Tax=Aureoumbra lagunensis TaxID=44058 RepID=A0A7S3NL25_9STRA|mmetsp:Transcript_18336/g.27647  ORF Transcript_18336/g.27647 Transcript_18336/m.27647 type:complete len:361 (+) Transcript_18336:63-1145(+)
MKILALEPFYGGAHKQWLDGFIRFSSHEIEVWSLPDCFWKWRMHGGALSFAERFLETRPKIELILASDFLDVATFKALSKTQIPIVTYFHENQFEYHWSSQDRDVLKKRESHYQFINFTSALSSDWVFFNSDFNRNSFLTGVKKLLKSMPDNNTFQMAESLPQKCSTLHLGLDLRPFDQYFHPSSQHSSCPLILWNHRWENDKNPDEFFQVLEHLSANQFSFSLVVLGQSSQQMYPKVFDRIKESLKKHLLQWGQVQSFEEYANWLWKADIAPITSLQDFFGIAVAEAAYCHCQLYLPKRNSYLELYGHCPQAFYKNKEDLISKIKRWKAYDQESIKQKIISFAWENQIEVYDQEIARWG